MARAINGGWDFVEKGGTYHYKEDGFLAEVTILEDNSNDEYYSFKLQVEQCNYSAPPQHGDEVGVFEISHVKEMDGMYSGMLQLYPERAYAYTPKYIRES